MYYYSAKIDMVSSTFNTKKSASAKSIMEDLRHNLFQDKTIAASTILAIATLTGEADLLIKVKSPENGRMFPNANWIEETVAKFFTGRDDRDDNKE
jgi:hypothetical protein